jgi:phage terminase large subunit
VFKTYDWIEVFPQDIDRVYFGGDVGQVAPSTVVKGGVVGNDLYVELLAYRPTETTNDYVDLLSTCVTKRDYVWVDSAASGYISAAQQKGYSVYAVKKFPGCRKFAAGVIKNYKLHLVRNQHHLSLRNEIVGLKYRMVNGIQLDEIADGNDHAIDALFYIALTSLRNLK